MKYSNEVLFVETSYDITLNIKRSPALTYRYYCGISWIYPKWQS